MPLIFLVQTSYETNFIHLMMRIKGGPNPNPQWICDDGLFTVLNKIQLKLSASEKHMLHLKYKLHVYFL